MIRVSEFLTTMVKPANVDYYTIIDKGTPDIITDQQTALIRWGQPGSKKLVSIREKIIH